MILDLLVYLAAAGVRLLFGGDGFLEIGAGLDCDTRARRNGERISRLRIASLAFGSLAGLDGEEAGDADLGIAFFDFLFQTFDHGGFEGIENFRHDPFGLLGGRCNTVD